MFETMEKLIAGFTGDMRTSIKNNEQLQATNLNPVQQVLITGLGGSGIGGTILSELLADSASIPVIVNKDYSIPAWVGKQSLVVACSYSGNTEETLAAAKQAAAQGAQMAAVTSGGQLLEIALQQKMPLVRLPEGYPPRAAFGHGLICLMALLANCGIGTWKPAELYQAADHLDHQSEEIKQKAKQLAAKLSARIPVLYAAEGLAGVAVRWRQQINENGKMLCWHHILPEMNHNELVGWAGGDNRMAVVFLRSADDHQRTAMRMDLNKEIIARFCDTVEEVHGVGNTRLERMYYLILFGDWLSYYLSVARNVDPIEVDVITQLKSELAKH